MSGLCRSDDAGRGCAALPPGRAAHPAFEAPDVDSIVALLTDDARLTMPPLPLQYQGRGLADRFLTATAFRPGWTTRLIATKANGQPAFGFYPRHPQTGVCHAIGLLVLTLSDSRICAMTRLDNSVLTRFGLPRTLPDRARTPRPRPADTRLRPCAQTKARRGRLQGLGSRGRRG